MSVYTFLYDLSNQNFTNCSSQIINLIDLDTVYIHPYDGLYCFQELVDYDLAKVINSSVRFSEFHIQSFAYQICCGLRYIHSADVIHRDLKPGNILVTVQGVLKICDFGLARGISPQFIPKTTVKSNKITNYVATRWYRAPELILSKKAYSKGVDMWAFGCILAELYGRRPLFTGKDQLHQIVEIMKVIGTPTNDVLAKLGSSSEWSHKLFAPPRPQFVCLPWSHLYPYAKAEAHELLELLLCWDPAIRHSCEKILAHDYFSNIREFSKEPAKSEFFDFTFENEYRTLFDLKRTLFSEMKSFKSQRQNSPEIE